MLGTTNAAKVRELSSLLADLPVQLVGLREVGGEPPEVEETGTTLEANALLKARAFAAWSGLPTIADDGGLEITALGGEPGVKSRRWLEGRDASDEELIAYTLARMDGVPPGRRGAAMRVVNVLVQPGGIEVIGEGRIEGVIAERASEHRDPGFPFRSVFKPLAFGKYYAELSAAEHEQVNHRRVAIAPIRKYLSR